MKINIMVKLYSKLVMGHDIVAYEYTCENGKITLGRSVDMLGMTYNASRAYKICSNPKHVLHRDGNCTQSCKVSDFWHVIDDVHGKTCYHAITRINKVLDFLNSRGLTPYTDEEIYNKGRELNCSSFGWGIQRWNQDKPEFVDPFTFLRLFGNWITYFKSRLEKLPKNLLLFSYSFDRKDDFITLNGSRYLIVNPEY